MTEISFEKMVVLTNDMVVHLNLAGWESYAGVNAFELE